MKTFAAIAMIAGTIAMGMHSAGASAADVKGAVDTNVKVGAVIQKNTGIANRNKAHLGSASGKASIGGNFKSRVKMGAIIQKNTGIANRSEVSLGSITD